MRKLSLLGSTGSIGTQALQVVQNLREQGEKWEVAALAARSSVNRLEEQARKFHPEVVASSTRGRPFPAAEPAGYGHPGALRHGGPV